MHSKVKLESHYSLLHIVACVATNLRETQPSKLEELFSADLTNATFTSFNEDDLKLVGRSIPLCSSG